MQIAHCVRCNHEWKLRVEQPTLCPRCRRVWDRIPGSTASRGLPLADRIAIWQDRSETNDRGCWLWTAYKSRDGYGQVAVNGKTYRVHSLAYEFFKGPIPEGHEIDHTCRVRCCWNPEHLEAVTHKVNCGRGAHALKTHCRNGHPYDAVNTRIYQGRRYCWECIRDASRTKGRES